MMTPNSQNNCHYCVLGIQIIWKKRKCLLVLLRFYVNVPSWQTWNSKFCVNSPKLCLTPGSYQEWTRQKFLDVEYKRRHALEVTRVFTGKGSVQLYECTSKNEAWWALKRLCMTHLSDRGRLSQDIYFEIDSCAWVLLRGYYIIRSYKAACTTSAIKPRSLAMLIAVSSIISSWPPIIFLRPSSTRISRAGTPKRFAARFAFKTKVEYTPA